MGSPRHSVCYNVLVPRNVGDMPVNSGQGFNPAGLLAIQLLLSLQVSEGIVIRVYIDWMIIFKVTAPLSSCKNNGS